MLDKTEKVVYSLCFLALFAVLVFAFYCPYKEMQTFNKYKKDSQPEATYMDALCSRLIINTE
jgi:hypothetical protein